MVPTEQDSSSYNITSPLIKSQQPEGANTSPMTNICCNSDTYPQYSVPPQMIISRTYSPGVPDNNGMYSSPPYGAPATIIQSPPFIHNTIGSPSPSPSTTTTSLYSNHHIAQPTCRTVYLGHMTPETQVSDILDQVRSGMIETTRYLVDKNCLFLTFVDPSAAIQFYYQVVNCPLIVKGVELKVGWGKPSVLSTNIKLSLQNGASRNVFLGSLDETVSENKIRDDLKRFGTIEHVRLIRDKNIAFVHFLSIVDAIKCVNNLSVEEEWETCRISYGRDRCCPSNNNNNQSSPMYTDPTILSSPPPPPSSSSSTSTTIPLSSPYTWHLPHYQLIQLPHTTYQVHYSSYDPYTGTTTNTYATSPPPPPHTIIHHHHQQHNINDTPPTHNTGSLYSYSSDNTSGHTLAGMANRTVYLGNIHPDTTCEDICNMIRGGLLYKIRYMTDKHIAFISFVDPVQALQFYTDATNQGMILKGRRLKLGWGKPSSLPGHVIHAVQNGGSRNVYLGNIDTTIMTEEKLRQDFAEYGAIELLNTLKEKNCAFVNFTSIAAAIRAMEGIRTKEEYMGVRINYGKDRCGNPPRKEARPVVVPSAPSLSLSSSSSSSASSSNGIVTPTTTPASIAKTTSNQDAPGTQSLDHLDNERNDTIDSVQRSIIDDNSLSIG
ncbi:hypothetical protein BC941DRAFT_437036 [Chlamydoabsidia padenii]|nr:hypothetical protein BC941DRAFT_437036 [Chlamydoabsidia padenii]